jgi:hypothetical protein
MSSPIYLIDSNVFIQAHRAKYPFDVMPSFWNKMKDLAHQGLIKSIDKVKVELIDNGRDGDELKEWCKNDLPASFFINSQTSLVAYTEIIAWATSGVRPYNAAAIRKFLATNYADPWLVAMAKQDSNTVVVTEEVGNPDIKKDVRIPDVCNEFNLPFINTIELLRRLSITI